MREARQQVAQAFWLREPGCGEIRPVGLPEPGPGDVVVRTVRSGISRGTETLVFRGAVPADQRTRMRAPFQEGDFPGPVKYGYLNVGAVEEGPAELRGRLIGTFAMAQQGMKTGSGISVGVVGATIGIHGALMFSAGLTAVLALGVFVFAHAAPPMAPVYVSSGSEEWVPEERPCC